MRFLMFGLVLVGLTIDASIARAQVFGRTTRPIARVLKSPRSVEQIIRDSERAIAEERWSEAVVLLGDFLERDPTKSVDDQAMQDYFRDAPAASNATIRGSSYDHARRLIGELPADAMDTYRLRYGPNAKRLLNEATSDGDFHKLTDVRRRYFHTDSGMAASIILAQTEWQRGNALACSFLLDDVVALTNSDFIDLEQIKVLYATACQASGRDLPEDFSLRGPAVTLSGDKQLEAGQTLTSREVSVWLTDSIGLVEINDSRRLSQYPWLGGLADRNGGMSGQMPLSRPEWIVDTTASPRETEVLERRSRLWQNQGLTAPPTSQPIRVNNQVLIRSTKWLIGVDFTTGKKKWTFPWFSEFDNNDNFDLGETQISDTNEESALIERVWNDLPFGQVSSDGEKVYFIEGLDSQERFPMRGGFRGVRTQQKQANTLVALELETEGKLSWRVGADEDTASSMSDAFFLGPPISVGQRLYVMAEFSGDIALLCLNPTTGEELWRQTLGVSEGLPIRFDNVRRSAGAMLTYHQGVLMCPTGAGLIVAFNLHDRTLRWAKSYTTKQANNSTLYGNNAKNPDDLIKRWSHGAAIAAGNRLVFTPRESDKLYALNVTNGEPVMASQTRKESMYLAGIRDDRFIVVGSQNVTAYNLSDGKPSWPKQENWLSPQQRICGTGVFGRDTYLVPTSTNELIEISLRDGSVVNRKTVTYPLGNLVAADGDLFIQTPTKVTYAAGVRSTQPRIAQRLELNPDDVEALTKQAKLILDDGERREAITLLRRIEELDPENDEVDQLLIDAMLAELRLGDLVDPELTLALSQRITQREQRLEFVRLQIDAAFRASRLDNLPNSLQELSQLLLDFDDFDPSSQIYRTDKMNVSLDDWISARLSRLAGKQNDVQRMATSDRFAAYIQTQLNQPTNKLERLLTQFSESTAADQVRDALAERYIATGDLVLLERMALGAIPPSDRLSLSSDRLGYLAVAYSKCGFPEDANEVLLELGERGDVELMNKLPTPMGSMTPSRDQWSDVVRMAIEDSSGQRVIGRRNRISVPTRSEALRKRISGNLHMQGWDLLSSSGRPLQIRDAIGRRGASLQLVQSPQARRMSHLTLSGMLAILEIDRRLIALDASEIRGANAIDAIWSQEVSSTAEKLQAVESQNLFGDTVSHNRIMVGQLRDGPLPELHVGPVLGDRMLMLKNGVLSCINTLTGETRWQNSESARAGVVTVDGDRVCVVSANDMMSASDSTATTYDLFDGTKLETKPWTHGAVWGSTERFLLAVSSVETTETPVPMYEVRLVNPMTDETVLSKRTTAKNTRGEGTPTIGHLKDSRWLALLNADGDLTVWDIATGRSIVDDKLALGAMPTDLFIIAQDDQLLIAPKINVRPTTNADGVSTSADTTNGTHAISGIYAYNRVDGTRNWEHRLDTAWGCTMDQPFASPLLVLCRLHTQVRVRDPTIKTLDLHAIDTRNGDLLAELLGQEVPSTYSLSNAKVALKTPEQIRVDISGLIANFEFQYGELATGNPDDGNEKVGEQTEEEVENGN